VALTREAVLAHLKTVTDPVSGTPLPDSGILRALTVEDGNIRFVMEVAASQATVYTELKERLEAELKALEGAAQVLSLIHI